MDQYKYISEGKRGRNDDIRISPGRGIAMYKALDSLKQCNDMIGFVFGSSSWKIHWNVERLKARKSIRKILIKKQ